MALALTLRHDLEVEVSSTSCGFLTGSKVAWVSTEVVLIATHGGEGEKGDASYKLLGYGIFIFPSANRLAGDSRLGLSFSCDVGDVQVVSYSTPPR